MLQFHKIGDFLLSSWIWGVTFDSSHLFITFFIMLGIARTMFGFTRLHAWIYFAGAQLISFIIFSVLVVGGLVFLLHWQYQAVELHALEGAYVLRACIYVATVHAALQTILYFLTPLRKQYDILSVLFIIWFSHGASALISYFLILIQYKYQIYTTTLT